MVSRKFSAGVFSIEGGIEPDGKHLVIKDEKRKQADVEIKEIKADLVKSKPAFSDVVV